MNGRDCGTRCLMNDVVGHDLVVESADMTVLSGRLSQCAAGEDGDGQCRNTGDSGMHCGALSNRYTLRIGVPPGSSP